MAGCACCGPFFDEDLPARSASHAGTWYPDDPGELREALERYLAGVPRHTPGKAGGAPPKALIVPHAGIRHSGATAAHAYAEIVPQRIRRLVVMGPSHKKHISGCALPAQSTDSYETPLGPVPLDLDSIEELRASGCFDELTQLEDEAEHSIEMQLPFAMHVMERQQGEWELLPLLVGALDPEACAHYAALLGPIFDDPFTLLIVSSDFCHWGEKFRFKPMLAPARQGLSASLVAGMGGAELGEHPVNAGVEALDMRALELIRAQDLDGFRRYLSAEGNTICGRHAISLLLALLSGRRRSFDISFSRYSQSRLLGSEPGPKDSSVSYVAGICRPV